MFSPMRHAVFVLSQLCRAIRALPGGAVAVLSLAIVLTVSPASAQVTISEILTSNHIGLTDEDGDTSDWIELYNDGLTLASLTGWHLTDDTNDLTKWTFPVTTINPKSFLVVFASGKDRATNGFPLHTSFSLSQDGGYLALVMPDGITVASEFKFYPEQFDDVSYGVAQNVQVTSILTSGAPARVFIPNSPALALTWTATNFNDSAWLLGTNGVGYETSVPAFVVTNYKANILVSDLNTAIGVINTPGQRSATYVENAPYIDYVNTGSGSHFGNDKPFPGLGFGDVEDFVVDAYATVTIPSAGNWTFGVNSDDGFRLTVGSFTMEFAAPRGPSDTLATFNFPAAGNYPLRLIYYERGGGSECELFAAPGSLSAYDGTFRLVGDTANGGLAVRASVLPGGYSLSLRSTIATDIQNQLLGINSSAYIRLPFTLADASAFTSLTLQMKYADGFVAYLNGTEVARRNAPTVPLFNSTATADRNNAAVLTYENINISGQVGLLQDGANVLAIQGLNFATNSPDFLIFAALTEFEITGTTNGYFLPPTPGNPNGESFSGFVADTKFSHDRGFYNTNFSLTITSATPGAIVRYTTNGSAPSLTNGLTYTAPLLINRTIVIRAAAFKEGMHSSDIDAQTYVFIGDVIRQSPNNQQPWAEWPLPGSAAQIYDYGMDPDIVNDPTWGPQLTNSLLDLPSFSIVMDLKDLFDPGRGIYANPSGDERTWERPASLELIYPDGKEGFQINCGIRIRGGFSRDPNNPKHAFRFFFRQDYGASKLKFPLFGDNGTDEFDKIDLRTMQNYSWAYQNDSRMMMLRDQFSRDAQLAMTGNAERGFFCHLYINGQYWGIYNTDERPEASFGASYYGGNREDWDAVKVDPDLGYVIEPTDGDMNAWTRLWTQMTNGPALANDTNYFKVQGRNVDGTINPDYENLLDVDQMIDYMLIILYGGNLDAPISNFLSNLSPNNYFGIRDRLGQHGGFRFFAHDSEHTLLDTNANRNLGNPAAGAPNNGGIPKSNPQYFWNQLANNAEFRQLVGDHVQKHCFNGGVLSASGALKTLLTRSNEIRYAAIAESARWGDSKRPTSPFTYNDWRNAMVTVGRDFIGARTTILLSQLRNLGLFPTNNAPIFSQYGGEVPSGYSLFITNPNPVGNIYYTLDGSDPRLRGNAIAPSAIAYSGTPITMTYHTFVRARVRAGNVWSALVEAHFYPAQDFASLLLSEVMYNPPGTTNFDGDSYEFLEFKNTGTNIIDMSGLFFSGINFTFTNGVQILPGQFLLLGRDTNAFSSKYPGLSLNGVYTGKLDNGGETLTLATALGTPVISVNYDDMTPWPVAADGHGFSLVPVNTNSNPNYNLASNWRASTAIGGSPGADDPVSTIAPILVNELLTHTLLSQGDSIELFNPTPDAVNIGGWFLTDDTAVLTKFRIPDGLTIDGYGYHVFTEADFNPTPGTNNSFALSSLGEDLYLLSGDANTNLTGYSHGVSFGAAATNVSFGRYITSIGEEHFPAQSALTLGGTNSGPRIGPVVINEIMYHPDIGFDEFIELRNITADPVPLFDPNNPLNTWKITGLGYTFPANVTIPALKFLLVVPIDPVAFRSKYLVPADVQIVGPYPGVLQDSGERLELKYPGAPTTNSSGQTVVPFITVDEVRYNDKSPWPPAADGGGPSLQRIGSNAYGDDPINWFASGVTPGRTNAINVNPTVMLTSPTNNSTYQAPANVSISADAMDPDGAILKVEFYADGIKIGEDSTFPYSIVWSNALTGTRSLTARAIDSSFSTVVSAPIIIVVNPFPVGNGSGLFGEYYQWTLPSPPANPFTNLRLSRVDATVNFAFGGGSPDPSVSADLFAVRWTGIVQPRFSDSYNFYTTTDDGVRLWVNNQLIINNWTDHGDTIDTGTISLTAGQPYLIRMEMYENSGGATAQLRWSTMGLPTEVIPQSQLYPFTNLDLTIIRQPQNTNVVKGRAATISILASSFSAKTYQWYYNQTNLLTGQTNATLTFAAVQLSDAGSYHVVVTDPATNLTSNPAILTVWDPPALVSPATPVRQTITAGDTIVLNTTVTGTTPISYDWRRNFLTFTNILTNTTSLTITLTNVQPPNATAIGGTNTYTVRLTNFAAVPLLLTNAFIKVLNPPVITNQPLSLVTNSGAMASFRVGSRGGSNQVHQWYQNGNPLLNQTNNILNLASIGAPSQGWYSVTITNKDGMTTSSNAFLLIDSLDWDGDGMSNRDEDTAGTDPTSTNSFLRIDGITLPDGIILQFLAVSNRSYSIDWRPSVEAGSWSRLADFSAVSNTNRIINYTNAPVGTNQQFYRLGAQKVP